MMRGYSCLRVVSWHHESLIKGPHGTHRTPRHFRRVSEGSELDQRKVFGGKMGDKLGPPPLKSLGKFLNFFHPKHFERLQKSGHFWGGTERRQSLGRLILVKFTRIKNKIYLQEKRTKKRYFFVRTKKKPHESKKKKSKSFQIKNSIILLIIFFSIRTKRNSDLWQKVQKYKTNFFSNVPNGFQCQIDFSYYENYNYMLSLFCLKFPCPFFESELSISEDKRAILDRLIEDKIQIMEKFSVEQQISA